MWKEKYQSTDNTKNKIKILTKMKRSPDERHTTHGSLTEMFQQSQMSFSIRRE
jgi:hypothetical protein